MMRSALVGVTLALVSSLAMSECPVQAAEYPAKPVKIVVPFPPGGAVDVIARLLAQKLSNDLGSQFYVENLPGAGGMIGTAAVAAAPADGYTLLFVAPDFVISALVKSKAPYDPLKSFAPVALVASAQEVITVNPSVPASNLNELLALLKANPDKYTEATPGYGTLGDLEGIRLFELSHGLKVIHVPFQGMAPAVTSTLAGHTAILFAPIALVASNIKDGTLRALAVEGDKRSPMLPDVPTLGESGIPNQESEFTTGVLVPAATPREIVDLIQQRIATILTLPDVKHRLAELGFDAIGGTPEAFTAWIKLETAKWAPVVHEANVKID